MNIWKQPKKREIKNKRFEIDRKEVLRSYRQNPRASQIIVISELNMCEPKDIKKILIEEGVIKTRYKRKKEKEAHNKALKLKREVEAKAKQQAEREKAQQIIFNRNRLRKIEFIILSNPKKQWDYMTEKEVLRNYTTTFQEAPL